MLKRILASLLRHSPDTNKTDLANALQLIHLLKTNGDRILVDLITCEIRGQEYTDVDAAEAEAEHQSYSMHNIPIISDPREFDVRQSVFIYNYLNNRTGQTERFISPVIPKDKLTLSFYLDRQKQTTLYVDKTNRRLYYFDLDFLRD